MRGPMKEIVVLYYSHSGAVKRMAQFIARGIGQVPGAAARLRTVAKISTVCEAVEKDVPTAGGGTPYGASHVAGATSDQPITDEDKKLCIALGKRPAETVLKITA